MTTDRANQIIEDAANAHGRRPDDVWSRLTSELKAPTVAGPYAAYGAIVQMCGQMIKAAGTDADEHEMAEALRGELKEQMQPTSDDTIHRIEASYIWARGETGDWTMDSELAFGKHQGLTVAELFEKDRDYANWIVKEMKADRPHLATLIALEEDRRREDEERAYTYWREEDHLLK